MKKETNQNDPIHPIVEDVEHGMMGISRDCTSYGLNKLEYFTACAMQGMVANYKPSDFKGGELQMTAFISTMAVTIAVGVISELNNES